MRGELRGWIPYRLQNGVAGLDCRWLYVGEKRFAEPFFEETTSSCMSLPENSFGPPRLTPLDQLPEAANDADGIEPSAFVFHVSRCGSTLVSQLLGLDESCVTLAEVPFFDQLLRARFRSQLAGKVDVATLLPAAIQLHAQRRFGTERSLLVKLDSWHTGFHAELRALYPRTPFILLYRHPAEVVRSHRKHAGMHAVRGVIEDAVFRITPEEAATLTWDAHLPRVLAFYYETFLEIARADSHSLLVPYQSDMLPAVESIADFCGLDLSEDHRDEMRARSAFHAKRPDEEFREPRLEDPMDHALQACLSGYESLERFRALATPATGPSPGARILDAPKAVR